MQQVMETYDMFSPYLGGKSSDGQNFAIPVGILVAFLIVGAIVFAVSCWIGCVHGYKFAQAMQDKQRPTNPMYQKSLIGARHKEEDKQEQEAGVCNDV
mmetsp:Transcript_5101/g.8421  ORF Transcript_5101/g.8421 Transcript_5101/m.8421 type:complete len:98 (+) Transcript_5101:120-413(+)|eukprot:CAMPEP_0202692018 /NCGR_PEP_ID=MMETSP1385-20130828/6526_1 /ASSEMBLY_ACC=CAM_ASM_000861 /TAXON_ID=933848 /ORGANISM="Elphidium margaritaceum" /LENGTH=97 /DNA_ID=CAMNT_0049347487 /DNA_START=86 /DNA_END=379 /DNA_ORIENTATION=-